MPVDRVCILGHSGIGKSPLSALFGGLPFEPRRKRDPRGPGDYVISQKDFDAERHSHPTAAALYSNRDPAGDWEVEVHSDVSFLKVRGKDQLLEHRDPPPPKPLRIEIYAPVLDSLLNSMAKLPPNLAGCLDPRRMVLLVLNPTNFPLEAMANPTTELALSVFAATTERAKAQGEPVDLVDTLERVRSLDAELAAWRSILRNSSLIKTECRRWSHFEYLYYVPERTLRAAFAELFRARETVLEAVRTSIPDLASDVEAMMLDRDHITRLLTIASEAE